MFAHKYLMKVVASLIFSVSSFISLIFMTRYVGEAYGMMMWGMALVATFNSALDIGFRTATIKMVSGGEDLNKCVSTYLAIRIGISAATAFLVLLTSLIMSVVGEDVYPSEFWAVAGVFIVYYILDNFHSVMAATFIGRMEAGKESIVLTAEYLTRSAALIVLAVFGASAVLLSFGYLIGGAFAVTTAFILFRRIKVKLVRPAFFKEYALFVTPLAIPLILSSVVAYIDKVMIGAFYGEIEVGYYAAAAGIIYSLVSLGTVMNGLLLSHMTKLNVEGKKREARDTLWAAQRYLAMLMLPATVFLLIFGNEAAVALFKDGFAASGPILSVLAFTIYLKILSGMFSQVLFSMGHTKSYGRSTIAHTVLILLLFVILIPGQFFSILSGGVGAATAVVVGKLLFVILLILSIKRLGASSLYPRIYLHIITALVVMVMLYCVKILFEPSGLVPLILLAMLSVVIYATVLMLIKEITKKDIAFIRDTLNPKNLYDDFISEIRRE